MADEILQLFITPLLELWKKLVDIIPNVLAALVFLLIGLTLARLVTTMVEKLLRRIKMDDYTSRVGINEILARVGFGKSPAFAVSFIVYWSIIVVFVILAANVLNLSALANVLEKFMIFLPKLVIAIILLFGGLLFARFMQEVVYNSATANNLHGGLFLAKATNFIIVIFAVLTAMEQLGIAMDLISSTIKIVLAALGLAFAIAVGLGAKDVAGEFIRELFTKKEE